MVKTRRVHYPSMVVWMASRKLAFVNDRYRGRNLDFVPV
jgi:hypothetical protein